MKPSRYDMVAIVLHWTVAFLIIGMFPLGWWMTDALEDKSIPRMAVFQAYQLHKSIGLTILVLSVLRLAWRLGHRPPPLPQNMPAWQVRIAGISHWAFYVLILAMPFSGWAMVSASVFGLPTMWFGLFQWPHLPLLSDLADKKPVEDALKVVHAILGTLILGLLALHIGAALKHHFVDRDGLLRRMVPLGS